MKRDYPFLIIGGGMTAAAAVAGIREVQADLPIAIVGAEVEPPYNRPPLSKGLWKGKPFDKIWRGTEAVPRVDLLLGRRAVALDAGRKLVRDDRGDEYGYGKLLLATGGTPRRLPFGGDRIVYFRTVADYRRLREEARPGRRFAVIGGGFIGSEIAAALSSAGAHVSLIFPGLGIGARIFPEELARNLNDYYQQQGVEVHAASKVIGADVTGPATAVGIQGPAGGTSSHEFDGVVAGIGIAPNTELAEKAGLEVDDGIVVGEDLRTSAGDVYAAGDAASFYNPALGKRIRVEHEDNAKTMGRLAGRSMGGDARPYHHLPFFYSDLFDLGYEAVGELDSRLETFADWLEPYRKGVVYYLSDRRVRGVLLWNVWDQVEHARKLIAEPGPFEAAGLKGRLPA